MAAIMGDGDDAGIGGGGSGGGSGVGCGGECGDGGRGGGRAGGGEALKQRRNKSHGPRNQMFV